MHKYHIGCSVLVIVLVPHRKGPFAYPLTNLLVSEALLAFVNELRLSEDSPGEFCILGVSGSARFLLWRSGLSRVSIL